MSEANTRTRVFAIVPAAGRSRRMGGDKQLLDVGGQPMLEKVLDTLCSSQVCAITLITHSAIAERIDTKRFANVTVAINDDERTEMIDSIRMGIEALAGTGQGPADNDGYLILPADQPGIDAADIDRCITEFSTDATRIVIASHDGRRGHPIILPASLVEFVRSEMCDMGLNALPRTHAERVVTIPCRSPGVIKDIDTSDDYESLA